MFWYITLILLVVIVNLVIGLRKEACGECYTAVPYSPLNFFAEGPGVRLRQILRFAKTNRWGNGGLPCDSRRPLLLTHISVREFRYPHKNFKLFVPHPLFWVWETQHTCISLSHPFPCTSPGSVVKTASPNSVSSSRVGARWQGAQLPRATEVRNSMRSGNTVLSRFFNSRPDQRTYVLKERDTMVFPYLRMISENSRTLQSSRIAPIK